MGGSGCATCGCRPGHPSASSSTATGRPGRRASARAGIACQPLDNPFAGSAAWQQAQAPGDAFPSERLHRLLARAAACSCPVADQVETTSHRSSMQVEYATDVVFHRQAAPRPVHEGLVRTAIHAAKPADAATFLGRALGGHFQDELGNDFHTGSDGTRLRRHRGPAATELYGKQGLVLRIETTLDAVSFLRHHRTAGHRDGTREPKPAPVQKTSYSLAPLHALLLPANRRSLAFLSDLAGPTAGVRRVERLAAPVRQGTRAYRGFNLFSAEDLDLFLALTRGEWHSSGFRNASSRRALPGYSGPQVSRLLKRLHRHGRLKKAGHTYKYHLTRAGQQVVRTALKLRALVVIPALAAAG